MLRKCEYEMGKCKGSVYNSSTVTIWVVVVDIFIQYSTCSDAMLQSKKYWRLTWSETRYLKNPDCGTQKQHHLLSVEIVHHCVLDHSIILEVEFSGVHLLYSDLLFTWTCLHFLMFAVSFAVYNAIDNSLNMLLQCFIHAMQLNSNARKHLISQMMLDI
jgi:hypothetical protein